MTSTSPIPMHSLIHRTLEKLFSKSKPKAAPQAGINYLEVADAIHSRMTDKVVDRTIFEDATDSEEANDDLAVVLRDAKQQFGLSDEMVAHFRGLYRGLFGSLNNANPRLDREAIDCLAKLGVNFQAVNELGQKPRDILVSIINDPATDAGSRRQAGVDLAYLEWVLIASETLADEEVAP